MFGPYFVQFLFQADIASIHNVFSCIVDKLCNLFIHNVFLQLWINSRGLTISVDDDSPLSVSINDPKVVKIIIVRNDVIMMMIIIVMQVFDGDGHGGGHGLCLQASFDEFPYYYHRSHSITCDEL